MPLDCLRSGEWGEVAEVSGDGPWVSRMAELGIRSGMRLQMLQTGVPCLLNVDGCRLCLRGDAICQILVRPVPR